MKNKKITVMGTGALGKALAYKFKKHGFNLAGIAGRSIVSAKSAGTIIGCDYFTINQAAKNKSDVYILAVPDKAITGVAKKIVGAIHELPLRKKIILIHLSGALPSDILKINKSCVAASAHPIGSFKNFESSVKTIQNVAWTLEGDKEAVGFARSFIERLSGNYYEIDKKEKPLYHAACTLSSAGILAVINASGKIFKKIKCFEEMEPLEILWHLNSSSLQNLKDMGLPAGVTGPWTRGDKDTIKTHKKALKNYDKNTLKLYNTLSARHRKITQDCF